ncbi:MAG: succinate dehydrogenase / fumarate reductase, cytochrome b subunit [Actinomycetota bacterium]|nr:succinate dehydrogenase / fumarate reductase, cytochrome b subunit [Actinomycetota bacterium]
MDPRPAPVSPSSTVYRGKSGQWAFVLHRITGFLVFFFLLLHVVDVSLISRPNLYNEVHRVYGNVLLRLFEVGLLAALLYHALNGLRIVLVDFFPEAIKSERTVFAVVMFITAALTVVGGYVIMKPFFVGRF